MSRHPHHLLTASVLAVTALLASCARTTAPHAQAAADTVMTVLQPGTATDAQLEAQYGGQLVTRTPGFALLKVAGTPATLSAQSDKVKVEKNSKVYRVSHDRKAATPQTLGAQASIPVWGSASVGVWGSASVGVWGSASVGVWGSASVGVWGSASVGVWGSSVYGPMPQNSDSWQQVALDDVQVAGRADGSGTTVAIIDTGVDLAHPAFQGRLSEPGTWHDFVDGDATPQDEGELGSGLVGHGTEVAGIVAQIAPLAKLMPLRVLSPDGSGDLDAVVAAVVWAADHGADVINLSLGSAEAVTALTQAIAYANSRGITVVAAAGNNGAEGLQYPAAEFAAQPLNVSVGSVSVYDVRSEFSQYGTGLELLAPGEYVFGPAPQERLAAWSGTSMSAPVVAGGLALGRGVGATGAQAAAALTGSADAVDAVEGNAAYRGKLGAGRVNLGAALSALGR